MGFYETKIFPLLCDKVMADPRLTALRTEALAPASGAVLEIGLGSGLNLPIYPSTTRSLVGIDPNPGMNTRAQRRASVCAFPVEVRQLQGEALPLPDASFDTVVSTFVLCTIAAEGMDHALAEIARVLKPGGRLLVLEHGLSDRPNIQKWQHRLNPIQKVVGYGCNLNRDVRALVERAGFRFEQLRTTVVHGLPPTHNFIYLGQAVRA